MKRRLYSIWHNMKSRCYNAKTPNYKYYGGRGIVVCDEWKNNFKAFYDWAVSNGYETKLTLDRREPNGSYSPSNCRWIDAYKQNNNKIKNHYITHNGETKTAAEWAKQYGIHRCVFNNRIRRGWEFEKAIRNRKG